MRMFCIAAARVRLAAGSVSYGLLGWRAIGEAHRHDPSEAEFGPFQVWFWKQHDEFAGQVEEKRDNLEPHRDYDNG